MNKLLKLLASSLQIVELHGVFALFALRQTPRLISPMASILLEFSMQNELILEIRSSSIIVLLAPVWRLLALSHFLTLFLY